MYKYFSFILGEMFVLFDGVWHPHPKLGKQPEPTPHVHYSGWVQSPGLEVLKDSTQDARLERYVKGLSLKEIDACWLLLCRSSQTQFPSTQVFGILKFE